MVSYHNLAATAADIDIAVEGPTASFPDNVLFNGTNVNFDGGGENFQVNVQRGKRHLLRLVNSGVDNFYQVGVGRWLGGSQGRTMMSTNSHGRRP